MTPQEIAGMAAAVQDAIAQAVATVREENAQALAGVARSLEQQRERADQLQRDLEAARRELAEPAIRAVLVDAEGVVHVVQRNGATVSARMVDLQEIVAAKLVDAMAEAEPRIRAECEAHITRAMLRHGNAPRWLRTAFYGPGAVVTCYAGRTYELRVGVASSIAQEPGEHPESWERIGSNGLRVMKSKPEQVEPGDVFTEAEARFISDGENTILFSPRGLKQSDLDRTFKPLQAELRAKRNGSE